MAYFIRQLLFVVKSVMAKVKATLNRKNNDEH